MIEQWTCDNLTDTHRPVNYPREDDAPEYHGWFVTDA